MPKVNRSDYRAPEYQVPHTYLQIDHYDQGTLVQSRLNVRREPGADPTIPLSLKKNELEIISIQIDGAPATSNQISIKDDEVLFHGLADTSEIIVHQRIMKPSENKSASGMYESNGDIYTQFEPEDDRRLYLSPSRPDMPTEFTIRIVADKQKYPTLLANPHLIETGLVENDPTRHYAVYNCPNKISSYLSCIIMGNLDYREVKTKKPNNEDVTIRAYAPKGYADYTDEALKVPQVFWDWQKKTYNLDYSLREYNMVFIPDYASGAMENEGLNTFNSCCLLPKKISTDESYIWAVGTIGHEQTHHVFGNRVPIEHWLDLALKEGLTTSMEQQFSRYYLGSDSARITNINYLISKQYPEDAGKLAHPVRNASYEDISNYYTITTYYKGAELWHTLRIMLGDDVWAQGIQTYVSRYTHKPATIQTLLDVMQEVSGQNLTQFARWFDHAGTPHVEMQDHYDPLTQTYTLTLKQSCPSQTSNAQNLPFHIPVKFGLLDSKGNEIVLDDIGNTTTTLHFTQAEQKFVFKCPEKPTPSLFRDFSAPVKIQSTLTFTDHCHLLAHDPDNISRWMSAQYLMKQAVKILLNGHRNIPEVFFRSLKQVLLNEKITKDVRGALIEVPNMDTLIAESVGENPLKLFEARSTLQKAIAFHLGAELYATYNDCYVHEPYEFTPEKAANRKLYNAAITLLCSHADPVAHHLARQQYESADAVNDKEVSIKALSHCGQADQYLADFLSGYDEGLERDLAIDHWIRLMGANEKDVSFSHVNAMTNNPAFIWERPNHVREFYRSIIQNIPLFHHDSGAGYQYLADIVLKLDPINQDLASNAVRALCNYEKLDPMHGALMLDALRKVAHAGEISEQLAELVEKSLPAGEKVLRAEAAPLSVIAYTAPQASQSLRAEGTEEQEEVSVKRQKCS